MLEAWSAPRRAVPIGHETTARGHLLTIDPWTRRI
jgi:hypothetical protein